MMWKTIIIILLTGAAPDLTGEPEVMGSHQPITVLVEQDVILPCYVRPSLDVRTLTVEWRLNTTLVHVYRNGKDDPTLQHKDFRDRTSLFHDEMSDGNLSLKLSSVNKSDAGNYTCFVPKLDSQVRKGYIALIVEDKDNTPKKKVNSTASATVPEDEGHKAGVYVGIGFGVGVVVFGIIIIIVIVVGKKMHGNTVNRVREEERRRNRFNSGSSQENKPEELDNLTNTDNDT